MKPNQIESNGVELSFNLLRLKRNNNFTILVLAEDNTVNKFMFR